MHHPQKHMKIYSNHHLNCPQLMLSSLLCVFMYAREHEGFFVGVLNVLMCVCLLSFCTCCKQVNTLKLKPQNNSCIIYKYLQSKSVDLLVSILLKYGRAGEHILRNRGVNLLLRNVMLLEADLYRWRSSSYKK